VAPEGSVPVSVPENVACATETSTTAIVNATTMAAEKRRSSAFAARVIPAFRFGDRLAAI
jgi:hypothetical protein